MMHLRLYTRYQNSAGQRIRIALGLKGIAYEYVPVTSVSAPEFLSVNPQGLMPALEIDGHVIGQSLAIFELLEELFPEPSLLPPDPFLKAEARSFALAISADLHPINNNRIRRYLKDRMGQPEEAVLTWYRHWVAVSFTALETLLARRAQPFDFCFGEAPGIADICLVPQMDNARRFDCDLAPYPLLVSIDAACRQIPAFADAAPEHQPDYPGTQA